MTTPHAAALLMAAALAPFFAHAAAGSFWRWLDARFQAHVDAVVTTMRAADTADAEWARIEAYTIAARADLTSWPDAADAWELDREGVEES